MFGRYASTEPRQQWLSGDVAWACAGMANHLASSGRYLGMGRRCP
jgi:hypothetical protein